MTYRSLGLMSGSSLDGLDLAFVEFHFAAGSWHYEILAADCYEYEVEWKRKLQSATGLSARDYLQLHCDYGHYLGQKVNQFIEANNLQFKVALIGSHGHTTFHAPATRMTGQLGDGAAIAAETKLPVVSDLRALDVAFGGQGAPIVPIGEKLLLKEYNMFLNLGGIANISFNRGDDYTAFDVCPANRILNLVVQKTGKEYDDRGQMAAAGQVHEPLLKQLNELDYYRQPFPKSLANDFGTDVVFPLVDSFDLKTEDALRTFTEHIAQQIAYAVNVDKEVGNEARILITGGGAFNDFLVSRISDCLAASGVGVEVPDQKLVMYKEALIMAFIAVLRWRQEYNVLSSVTGASRNTINGALWTGQEA